MWSSSAGDCGSSGTGAARLMVERTFHEAKASGETGRGHWRPVTMVRDIIPGRSIPSHPNAGPRRGPRRLAALLIAHLCPISFALRALCDKGAALLDLCHDPR